MLWAAKIGGSGAIAPSCNGTRICRIRRVREEVSSHISAAGPGRPSKGDLTMWDQRAFLLTRLSRGLIPVLGMVGVFAFLAPQASAACTANGRACGVSSASSDRLCCPGNICGPWGNVCQPGCRISGVAYRAGTINPANACQVCRPSLSTTSWSPAQSGTTCNDGDACTRSDTCRSGACAGTAVDCSDRNACTLDSCDRATGCVHDPVDCDDNNGGTQDSCDPATGCVHTVSFGPVHTFAGLSSTHFITQGCCSVNVRGGTCNGNADENARYFCERFYGAGCVPLPGYRLARTPNCSDAKMHKGAGCTSNGSNIAGTTCDGGPCKIGNWIECTDGLTDLVCSCP